MIRYGLSFLVPSCGKNLEYLVFNEMLVIFNKNGLILSSIERANLDMC